MRRISPPSTRVPINACGPPRRACRSPLPLTGVCRGPAQPVHRRARAPRGHRPFGVVRTRSSPRGISRLVRRPRGEQAVLATLSHSGPRVTLALLRLPTRGWGWGGRGGFGRNFSAPLLAQRFRREHLPAQGRLYGPCYTRSPSPPRARGPGLVTGINKTTDAVTRVPVCSLPTYTHAHAYDMRTHVRAHRT